MARIEALNVFPVKGLSAQRLQTVTLSPGQGIPGDRLFGFARPGSGFDPENPRPLPKEKFVVLVREAALAGLKTDFAGGVLNIDGPEGRGTFDVRTVAGQRAAARYLQQVIGLSDDERPEFVSAEPHRFTDVSVVSAQMMNAVSVLNLETLRDFEERVGEPVHPDRFRANIVISGLPAWSEMESTGSQLVIGDAVVRTILRTKRCDATEVNPENAERDLKVPFLLRKTFGHMDMGVYAEVTGGGTLSVGDSITLR